MKTQNLKIVFLFLALYLTTPLVFSQDLGATFAWQYLEIYGGHDHDYNQSIVKSGNPPTHWSNNTDFWENTVEEIEYSGIDYVALLSRGNQPNTTDRGNGNPKHIPKMVNAMNARGINSFKLSIFDDCPNSWSGSKNWYESGGTVYSTEDPKFDLSVADNYKYIWDYNLKEAIGHIPDERRYKIDGRMVIFFWTIKPTWFVNIEGSMPKILQHIKDQCKATYGFEPYLIISQSWFEWDSTLKNSGTFDAVHNWFSSFNQYSYTLTDWNGTKTGVAVPGFGSSADPDRFLDPAMGTSDNSARLKFGLENTVKKGARTTLIEGFTDAAESAALWRSTDEGRYIFYDYPNQRLNALRSYSKTPYPANLKMEVEACDFHFDTTTGNSGGAFLDRGDLDVIKSTDEKGGWMVTNTQATEWMEWRELPMVPVTKFEIRYRSSASSSIVISIDGVPQPTTLLPSTENVWSTLDMGMFTIGNNSNHTVRFTIASGSPQINYFNRVNAITGPVNVTSVSVTPNFQTIVKTKTAQLSAQITPSYATNAKVIWSTSDATIATVDAFGLVTGINVGVATITATSEEGAKTATSTISVVNPTTVLTLQAEDAVYAGPVFTTNQTGYNGRGFLDFTNNTGDTIKWTVTVPDTGSYDLSFRYALPNGGRPLELKVNGQAIENISFPATTTWTNWQNIIRNVILNAGSNEILLSSIGSNGGNFDELVVTNTTSLGTDSIAAMENKKSISIYPNPYKNGGISLDLAGFEGQNMVKIKIINGLGQTIYETSTANPTVVTLNPTQKLNEAIYFVSIEAGDTQIIKKLIVK